VFVCKYYAVYGINGRLDAEEGLAEGFAAVYYYIVLRRMAAVGYKEGRVASVVLVVTRVALEG